MKKQSVIWGIIGCGKIAEKVAEDIRNVDHAELIAVAARDQRRAMDFGARFGAEKCYESYRELVEDASIDVVYIANIHPHHAEATLLCLSHGKAVMCEKPLAMNEEDVREVIDLARSKKLFLMEAIWTRFFPIVEQALELIEQGRIGEVKVIQADFGFKARPETVRLFDIQLGGGSLLDIGIYPLFISMMILGDPEKITATASFTKGGVDESCNMILDYKNGAQALLNSTLIADTPTEAWIHGSEGSIKLHSRFHNPSKLSLWKDDQMMEEMEVPIEGNGYGYEIKHVNTCLQKGLTESPLLTHDISISLMRMLDATRRQIGLEY
ncbi:putative dehydrogenase [Ochromonadaceae sp. CCMP2298]|nr:putative dehydrogenase [Ochromonadaceae sp. CCMP2298]